MVPGDDEDVPAAIVPELLLHLGRREMDCALTDTGGVPIIRLLLTCA